MRPARTSVAPYVKVFENAFLQKPSYCHFDGNLLPDCSGANADRMPIVVSGKNVEKLLLF